MILLFFFCCKEKSSPVDSENGDNDFPQITVNWQLTNGPAGGNIKAISFGSSGYIYVGTDGNGVFRSSDNGNKWYESINEIWNPFIRCLGVNDQGHVFAATGNEGLFRSTDNGASWQDISLGRGGSLHIIAISPDGEIYISDDDNLERSSDNGENWLSTGLPGGYDILFFDSDKMLIAGWDSIYFSEDNCQTWIPVAPIYNVRSMVIDASGNIFAAGQI